MLYTIAEVSKEIPIHIFPISRNLCRQSLLAGVQGLSNMHRQSYKKNQESLSGERLPRKGFRLRCHILKNELFFVPAADYSLPQIKGVHCCQTKVTARRGGSSAKSILTLQLLCEE